MIPDRAFIRHCAEKRHRSLPIELENWIFVRFEDEPFEDFFDADTMENLVCMFCDHYAAGRLDVSIPDPLTRWKERCENYKDLIQDLLIDNQQLSKENDLYRDILKEHGLI